MRVVGIRDFEMPSCCAGCKFGDLMREADGEPYDYFLCLLNDQEHDPEEQHRPFNCPLVWADFPQKLPSAQPEQRYTEEELRVFQHGISLSLLSKRSAQHWHYDEDTATEIKFLERLYEKVGADIRGERDEE